MSVLTYACKIETEPGVTVPLERCSVADLTAARVLEARKVGLYTQVTLMLADAARHDLHVPDELRERAARCRGDLRELEGVCVELEDALFAPV
jgi:hypothetical protein